jgi:predicted nucleic acid-binding Zn ribbon protein
VMQKMSADPLQECPKCHASALKKLMSVTGLVKSSSHGGGGHSCGSGGCSSCH